MSYTDHDEKIVEFACFEDPERGVWGMSYQTLTLPAMAAKKRRLNCSMDESDNMGP